MTINTRPLGRSALITYGSETGNAQDFAEELGRLTQRLRFMTRVCRLDAVELVCAIRMSAWRGFVLSGGSRLYPIIL